MAAFAPLGASFFRLRELEIEADSKKGFFAHHASIFVGFGSDPVSVPASIAAARVLAAVVSKRR